MLNALNPDATAPSGGSDLALARRAARDRAAFAELYRHYLPTVYRYLLARLGSVEGAEEVTAQTFEAALLGIGRFGGRSSLATWLLGIARRKAADYFRQQRPTSLLDAASEIADAAPPLDEQVMRGLRLEQVAQVMRCLAPERAEALALRLFAGLSTAEAAQVMGKRESAVKMLVHRAVRDMQTRLAPQQEDVR
ncbi:MAG: RNA polymerase sigma factor [Ardenticatenaceae bacterium]